MVETISIKSPILDGQYKIVKKIGQGSFGKVYLAIDLKSKDKMEVAIKTEPL